MTEEKPGCSLPGSGEVMSYDLDRSNGMKNEGAEERFLRRQN